MKGDTFFLNPKKVEDTGISPNVIRLTDEHTTCNHLYFHNRSFTPDDKHIVFESERDVGNNLYIVELATNKVTQLTEGYDLDYFGYPSRDGKKVFFGAEGCIKAVRLDNLEEEIILRAEDVVKKPVHKCSGAFPSWDGKKLICFYEAAPEFGLIVLDFDTGEKKIILQGEQHVRHMQFCPSDSNLVLIVHEGGSKTGMRCWLMNADGSNYRPLRDCNDRERQERVSHEFWANHSRKVYFTISKDRIGKTFMACVDLDTNKEETLFEVNASHGTITQDDKYIITDSNGDNGEMWIYNLATKDKRVLCHHNFIWAKRGVSSRDTLLKASRHHPHPTVSYTTNKCIFTTNSTIHNAGVFLADIPTF